MQKRILVLGGTGMLGHKMFQILRDRFEQTFVCVQDSSAKKVELFQDEHTIEGVDVTDAASLTSLLESLKPDVIVNCVGVIKQRSQANAFIPSITINALFPHRLAEMANARNSRLIHFSTDCVFSGKKGNYLESDQSDAEDLYGRSKLLGEVSGPNALTLRTSMIGRELKHFHSLLEWFLRQKSNRVEGYKHALYSGLTTNALARVVGDLIEHHPQLTGLYQVTGRTISKFDLLTLIQQKFKLPVEVVPDEMVYCDRSMNGERFKQATGFVAPSWPELIDALVQDKTPYDKWTAALA
jgi:dTDP-4-dehydrorhamnose reductase